MTASTPCRSGSACHRSTASPTRDAASWASTSSHDPGKRTTPAFIGPLRPSTGPPVQDLVVLDERIRQQTPAHRVQGRRVVDVELDQTPDVHVGDAAESEGGQGALDRDA